MGKAPSLRPLLPLAALRAYTGVIPLSIPRVHAHGPAAGSASVEYLSRADLENFLMHGRESRPRRRTVKQICGSIF